MRTWTDNPVKVEQKKKVLLDDEQIRNAAKIYRTWQNEGTNGADYAVPELYRSVKVWNKDLTQEEINNHVNTIESCIFLLIPSQYIKFIDHDLEIDYETEMKRIQGEMHSLLI